MLPLLDPTGLGHTVVGVVIFPCWRIEPCFILLEHNSDPLKWKFLVSLKINSVVSGDVCLEAVL